MISLNTGGSTSPLITARMTKRRTGTAISRIVMNQWRRFNKRFFQRSTRNFENVLMFALTQNLTSTTRKGGRQKFPDGRREGYLRKRRCLCVSSTTALSLFLFHKSRSTLCSYQRHVTGSLVMTMKMANEEYGIYAEIKSTTS